MLAQLPPDLLQVQFGRREDHPELQLDHLPQERAGLVRAGIQRSLPLRHPLWQAQAKPASNGYADWLATQHRLDGRRRDPLQVRQVGQRGRPHREM